MTLRTIRAFYPYTEIYAVVGEDGTRARLGRMITGWWNVAYLPVTDTYITFRTRNEAADYLIKRGF